MNQRKAKALRRFIYRGGSSRNDGSDRAVALRRKYRMLKKIAGWRSKVINSALRGDAKRTGFPKDNKGVAPK